MRLLLSFTLLLLPISVNAQWVRQTVDTTAAFRGLAVVNEKIVWASGTGGTVIRTIDGGKTWDVITVAGAEKLDFRDIEAFDGNTAYILSIGTGDLSRIYKTTNGGRTWTLQFINYDKSMFFDALTCPNRYECFAMSDPVNGSFPVIGTGNGGGEWSRWALQSKVLDGEAAFAASGTCFSSYRYSGGDILVIVSGGARSSVYQAPLEESSGELFRSETPIVSGSSGSGIFSIAMFDQKNGVIVGGNYEKPDEHERNLAFTTDGETWDLGAGLTGYRSGVTYVNRKTIIAVGTNGSDITRDGGKTWSVLGKENLNAVASKGRRATWAVGPKGMVVKLK